MKIIAVTSKFESKDRTIYNTIIDTPLFEDIHLQQNQIIVIENEYFMIENIGNLNDMYYLSISSFFPLFIDLTEKEISETIYIDFQSYEDVKIYIKKLTRLKKFKTLIEDE